jgi:uncharacterized protein with FMN-binding domain
MSTVARRVSIALFAISLCFSLGACMSDDHVDKLVIADVPISTVRDGTYEGEFTTPLVIARVQATVTIGRLVSVRVLKHRHGPGHGADAIVDRVIAAQSLKVDAISGATTSSKVMLKALQLALEKGQSRAGG